MNYKNTELLDSTKIDLTLTLRQIKSLDYAVGYLLGHVERGLANYPEKPLQKLCDVFFPILNVELSEEEKLQHMRAWRLKIAEDELAKFGLKAVKQDLGDLAVQP